MEDSKDERKTMTSSRQSHQSGDSASSITQYIPTPLDGGYGWVIVLASFLNHVICDGITLTFGVFYIEFLEYFRESRGKTTLVGSLLAGCYLLTAPISSGLVNRFGCRVVCMSGSLIAAAGFTLSIFSYNVNVLMITYGVVGGIGLGLMYLPNIVAVSFYFQRRRAVATGLAVCGAGVGCFIFAPLGRFLLDTYDWKNAMLIIAGISLNGCVLGALLRPLESASALDISPQIDFPPEEELVFDPEETQKTILQKIKSLKRNKIRETGEAKVSESETASNNHSQSNNSQKSKARRKDSHNIKYALFRKLIAETHITDEHKIPETRERSHSDVQPYITPTEVPPEKSLGESAPGVLLAGIPGNLTVADLPPMAVDRAKVRFDMQSTNDISAAVPDHQDTNKLEFTAIEKKSISAMCVSEAARRRLRHKHQVEKKDYRRPLYRRDIFYSGSLMHLTRYDSSHSIEDYYRHVTVVPKDDDDERHSFWMSLPISKSVRDIMQQMTDLSLLRDPIFLIPCLVNLLATVGLFIPFVFITQRAISLGINIQNASFLLSLIGITNTLGRIMAGFFADFPWINTLLLHNVALVAGGAACILNCLCVYYPLMCLFAAFFGLCVAAWISLTSVVLCDLVGIEQLTSAFGILTMTRGIAAMIGSPLAGIVFDKTNNYDASFHVGGVMMLLGGCICCLMHLPTLYRRTYSYRQRNFSKTFFDNLDNNDPI